MDIKEALEWTDKSDPFYGNRSTVVQVLATEVRRLQADLAAAREDRNTWHTRAEAHRLAKEAAEAKLARAESQLSHYADLPSEAAKALESCDIAYYKRVLKTLAALNAEKGE